MSANKALKAESECSHAPTSALYAEIGSLLEHCSDGYVVLVTTKCSVTSPSVDGVIVYAPPVTGTGPFCGEYIAGARPPLFKPFSGHITLHSVNQ